VGKSLSNFRFGRGGIGEKTSFAEMPPEFPQHPADASADPHARFMRLFLASEKEIFRYVAVLVPKLADAQDVVQQTAIALWKKFDQYDPAQPFTPWACRFALYEAREFLRRDRRRGINVEEGLVDTLLERRAALGDEMELRFAHLRTCLNKLPIEQRRAVESYYYERTPIETLAERSGKSVEALYKILQRVRAALLECVNRALKAEGGAS
jgi:RNA polymerase sigma-70 factor (ECF subfamily)